jgi:hypothetical protein
VRFGRMVPTVVTTHEPSVFRFDLTLYPDVCRDFKSRFFSILLFAVNDPSPLSVIPDQLNPFFAMIFNLPLLS